MWLYCIVLVSPLRDRGLPWLIPPLVTPWCVNIHSFIHFDGKHDLHAPPHLNVSRRKGLARMSILVAMHRALAPLGHQNLCVSRRHRIDSKTSIHAS